MVKLHEITKRGDIHNMIKERMAITVIEFKRQATASKILLWLQKYGEIVLYQRNDAICEIHPPGTGKRLAELEAKDDRS